MIEPQPILPRFLQEIRAASSIDIISCTDYRGKIKRAELVALIPHEVFLSGDLSNEDMVYSRIIRHAGRDFKKVALKNSKIKQPKKYRFYLVRGCIEVERDLSCMVHRFRLFLSYGYKRVRK
jgi:hypothetical protein